MSTRHEPSRSRTCRVCCSTCTRRVPFAAVTTWSALTTTYAPVAERGASGLITAFGAEHTADSRAATIPAHSLARAGAVSGSKSNRPRSVISGNAPASRVPSGVFQV